MALTLENSSFTWQKVFKLLEVQKASPLAVDSFRALRKSLETQGVANLQVIPFSDISTADPGICQNTGYSPIGGVTSLVYAAYAKNGGLGDGTDAYIRLYNDTTNTTITLAFLELIIQDDNDEVFTMKKDGWRFATDLTISSDTGAGAGTESAAANAANGFVIVGA